MGHYLEGSGQVYLCTQLDVKAFQGLAKSQWEAASFWSSCRPVPNARNGQAWRIANGKLCTAGWIMPKWIWRITNA